MAAFFAHFESSNHFQRNVLSKSLNADLWLIQLQKRQKTHGMNQCLHITVLIWVFRYFSLVKSAKNPKMSVMGENGIYAQAKVSKMFFAENVVYHCMAFL